MAGGSIGKDPARVRRRETLAFARAADMRVANRGTDHHDARARQSAGPRPGCEGWQVRRRAPRDADVSGDPHRRQRRTQSRGGSRTGGYRRAGAGRAARDHYLPQPGGQDREDGVQGSRRTAERAAGSAVQRVGAPTAAAGETRAPRDAQTNRRRRRGGEEKRARALRETARLRETPAAVLRRVTCVVSPILTGTVPYVDDRTYRS